MDIQKLIEEAGAARESDTERDGFLSYSWETHASSLGLAAGFMATAYGELSLLSLVYGAAVYGKGVEEEGSRGKLLKQVAHEWHYALFGVLVGTVLGLSTRILASYYAIPADLV